MCVCVCAIIFDADPVQPYTSIVYGDNCKLIVNGYQIFFYENFASHKQSSNSVSITQLLKLGVLFEKILFH